MGQYNLREQISQTLDIAKTLIHPSPFEAIRLADQSAERANILGYGAFEAEAALIKLLAYRAEASTPIDVIESTALHTIALAQLHQQEHIWLEALNWYADILFGMSQYDAAMDYWLQLLEVGIDRNWAQARAQAYIGIGKLFWIFEDHQSCLEYTHKAQHEMQQVKQVEAKVCLLINLAAYAYHRRQYLLSHQYIDQAQELVLGIPFCEYEPEIYYYRGYLFRAEGKIDAACDQLKRALVLNAHSSNNWGKAVTMIGLGEINLDAGRPHQALYFLNQALEVSSAMPNPYLVMQSHELLARCHNALGQTDLEFQHWSKHFDLSDGLVNHVMNHRLASFKRQSLQLRVHELENSAA
ncbi:tetratricopeptide repeat protein [Chitinibacter sp. FCG-7]|uniref:Tetratricopeptide repeat protein n=1 Tax=Chitinibacter mangrovi TaxID=3153927 RepID=A0AAU7F6I9_9NEIS